MLAHGEFTAKYGVQTTFYLALEDATAVDAPFVGTAPLAADIFLSKDGGATAAATNAMTAIGNGVYSWVATATEMQATRLAVSVYDQTATEIFKPIFFTVLTKLQLGQIDVDATQIGSNAAAMALLAHGTGAGIDASGGATNPSYGIYAHAGSSGGAGVFAYGVAGNSSGFSALGTGTSSGLNAVGGATDGNGALFSGTGAGIGLYVRGGTSGGEGAKIEARGGNAAGLLALGFGTQPGAQITGGATGHGAALLGGATSGVGFRAAAAAGNSNGVEILGSGSGHGISSTGGTTGDGLRAVGGSSSGHGIDAIAVGSGDGFHGVGAGGGSAANFGGGGSALSWDDLEGTEPSGAPPANASFRQILQYLKRCELNYATEGGGTRRVYKDDSSTVLYSQTITADPTTRTRGGAV